MFPNRDAKKGKPNHILFFCVLRENDYKVRASEQQKRETKWKSRNESGQKYANKCTVLVVKFITSRQFGENEMK